MPTQSIGITAMELFACNPYRALGVAVNTSEAAIKTKYDELLKMVDAGEISQYKTPFDFPSLPPHPRTAASIKAAYAKLASNGYRCFAYADGEFTTALNIDDVALNLRDITCYDCFLRCYMWLVINDREMEEVQLWIQLAQYIDKLITSDQSKWATYFDGRFPENLIDDKQIIYKSFHKTFCDIILLPLKEMVRGAMKCTTATEVIMAKGIDLDEEFPFIEIPQANIPKDGEPAPKLKLALKDGDEFFDISTGKMMSFASDSSANIESHEFAEAAAPISADALFDEPEAKPAPTSVADDTATSMPTRFVDFEDELDDDEDDAPITGFIKKKPASFVKRSADEFEEDSFVTDDDDVEEIEATAPKAAPKLNKKPSEAAPKIAPKLKMKKDRTSLLDNNEIIDDSSEIALTEDVDDEESNQYTDALIQMLRANKSKNQFMKDVDTSHVFDNGDQLEPEQTPDVTMDDINMKKYDSTLLNSPYEVDEVNHNAVSREEKYRNVKIDDMLNPTMGNKFSGSFEPDPIEQFKKDKAQMKSSIKFLIKLGLFAALCVAGFIALKFIDIL